jgi:hypothetical protein
VGLTAYFVGAIVAHLRKGDIKGAFSPLAIIITVAAMVLRIASL